LLACRAWLGVAEAGGIPAAGKAIQQYLKPEERALGNGLNQTGVFLGAILAPPVATWLAIHYGWPSAFLATGAAGIFWIMLCALSRVASLDPHLNLSSLCHAVCACCASREPGTHGRKRYEHGDLLAMEQLDHSVPG
jgi:MFS family permease